MEKEDFRTKYHCCMVQVGGENSNENDTFRNIFSVEKMCDEMGMKCRQLGNKQSLRLWITDPFMPERPRYLPYTTYKYEDFLLDFENTKVTSEDFTDVENELSRVFVEGKVIRRCTADLSGYIMSLTNQRVSLWTNPEGERKFIVFGKGVYQLTKIEYNV